MSDDEQPVGEYPALPVGFTITPNVTKFLESLAAAMYSGKPIIP